MLEFSVYKLVENKDKAIREVNNYKYFNVLVPVTRVI